MTALERKPRREWTSNDFVARTRVAQQYVNRIVYDSETDGGPERARELRTLMINAFLMGAEVEAGRDLISELSPRE